MRIEYVSACHDSSGYGAAARNYIGALVECGANVSLRPISFEQRHPDLGAEGRFLQGLIRDGADADWRIVHATPDTYRSILAALPAKPTIGYCAWETDRIPQGWAREINDLCAQLWVPSSQNVDAFRNSGVTVPIHRVPHCFRSPPIPEASVLPKSDDFRFLSVFQWTERKNPIGLLKAYLTEFKRGEPVSLVLKTYLRETNSTEKAQIRTFIDQVKAGLYLTSYPRIELVVATLSGESLTRLYHDCDAYVALSRNEGFGVPLAEAMMAGKPVITTDYGGPSDFVEPGHGFLIPHTITPVFGMPWATYTGEMSWAEPDLAAAKRAMRSLFADRDVAHAFGQAAKQSVSANLSYAVVGKMMLDLLVAR